MPVASSSWVQTRRTPVAHSVEWDVLFQAEGLSAKSMVLGSFDDYLYLATDDEWGGPHGITRRLPDDSDWTSIQDYTGVLPVVPIGYGGIVEFDGKLYFGQDNSLTGYEDGYAGTLWRFNPDGTDFEQVVVPLDQSSFTSDEYAAAMQIFFPLCVFSGKLICFNINQPGGVDQTQSSLWTYDGTTFVRVEGWGNNVTNQFVNAVEFDSKLFIGTGAAYVQVGFLDSLVNNFYRCGINAGDDDGLPHFPNFWIGGDGALRYSGSGQVSGHLTFRTAKWDPTLYTGDFTGFAYESELIADYLNTGTEFNFGGRSVDFVSPIPDTNKALFHLGGRAVYPPDPTMGFFELDVDSGDFKQVPNFPVITDNGLNYARYIQNSVEWDDKLVLSVEQPTGIITHPTPLKPYYSSYEAHSSTFISKPLYITKVVHVPNDPDLIVLDDGDRPDEAPLSQGGLWTGPFLPDTDGEWLEGGVFPYANNQFTLASGIILPDLTDPNSDGEQISTSYRTDIPDTQDIWVACRLGPGAADAINAGADSPALVLRAQNIGTSDFKCCMFYLYSDLFLITFHDDDWGNGPEFGTFTIADGTWIAFGAHGNDYFAFESTDDGVSWTVLGNKATVTADADVAITAPGRIGMLNDTYGDGSVPIDRFAYASLTM